MESMSVLERTKGGTKRTRRGQDETEKETGGSAASFLFEGDSVDDVLSKRMPSLKRQFEAFDDDEGTLNFMGEINMTKEKSCRLNVDKENVTSDWNLIRQAQRRRGSSQVTTSRPIDFNKLASSMTVVPSLSSSLYRNITMALKENVNRAGNQSQILDDFWSTEKKKKISAVARGKLTGIKTPAQSKTKAVEDRNVRHARSRRGGDSRTVDKRALKLDLRLDAVKYFEWDQEALPVEEVPPSTSAYSGAFMSAGRPPADVEEEVPSSIRASSGAVTSVGRPAADSPCSFPDMELSPGQSPLVEVPELSGRVEYAQTPLQDPGSAHAGFPAPESRWSNLQIQRFPLTSPTPPNPMAVYVSLRHSEADGRQRRLSFLSSPSSERIHTGGGREEMFDLIDGKPSPATTASPEVSKSLQISSSIWKNVEDVQAGQQILDTEESASGEVQLKASCDGAVCILSQDENALLTISHDYPEDDEDLELPKTERLHDKCNGSCLGVTEPNGLQQNQEESFGEVPMQNENQILPNELRETGNSEVAPPCADVHRIEIDEGSTTQTKSKRVKRRAKKAENTRFSLEGCGSTWKEGHRRSQRIRIRPLEWWRGEKALYARVHDTLISLVGIKHSSSEKYARGIDAPFAVESYVPAQYTDLVRFVAN